MTDESMCWIRTSGFSRINCLRQEKSTFVFGVSDSECESSRMGREDL